MLAEFMTTLTVNNNNNNSCCRFSNTAILKNVHAKTKVQNLT